MIRVLPVLRAGVTSLAFLVVIGLASLLCTSSTATSVSASAHHQSADLDLYESTLWNMQKYPHSQRQGSPQNSRNLDHVNLEEYNRFFKDGTVPEEHKDDWPESLESTIDIEIIPVARDLDQNEVAMFVSSIDYFYRELFQAQDEYDLVIREIEVLQQYPSKDVDILIMQTNFKVNFRKISEEQSLSDSQLQEILVHLMNRFDIYMTDHLQMQHPVFHGVESVSAAFESTNIAMELQRPIGSTWESNKVSILAIVFSGLILMVFGGASIVLYRRETSEFRKMGNKKHGVNLSPFRDSTECADSPVSFGHSHNSGGSTPLEETITFIKDRQAFLDIPKDSLNSFSFPTTDDILPSFDDGDKCNDNLLEKPRLKQPWSNISDRGSAPGEFGRIPLVVSTCTDASTTSRFTSDDTLLQTDMEKIASRSMMLGKTPSFAKRECFAPAGKLGVAIDTVDGRPVIHRIKDGSPLEGVLQRLDQIVAINDVDTSCMSAADVTHLMVKGIGKPRKISYIRINPHIHRG